MDKGNTNDSLEKNEVSSESPNTFATSNFNPSDDVNTPPPISQTPATNTQPLPNTEDPAQSTVPEIKDTPSNDFITTAGSSETKKSKFGKFVIFGIIFIALIYGAVFFLYTRNQKIKDSVNNMVSNPIFDGGGNSEPSPTPTPEFSADYVKVLNGNIVYESGSESQILINKNDFPTTGITGFTRVTVSPDNTKICFEALPPAIETGVYVAKSDGKDQELISSKKSKCIFTHDSKKILYESSGTPEKDIFIFDLEAPAEKNLTADPSSEVSSLDFELVALSADGTKAVCNAYNSIDDTTDSCEVDIETGEISLN